MKERKIIIAILVIAILVTALPHDVVAKTVKMKNFDEERIIPLYSEVRFETGIESWKLKYTFSDEEVAKVTKDAWIKATMPGKTTIRIRKKGSKKKVYKIHLTVREPKGYSISKPGHNFHFSHETIELKAEKGYTVYYTTDLKFRTNQKIQSGKTKSIVFSTSTHLKVYAVKKRKKVTSAFLNRNGISGRNYGEYNYYYFPPCGGTNPRHLIPSPQPSPQSTPAAGQPGTTMMPLESPEPTATSSGQPQPIEMLSNHLKLTGKMQAQNHNLVTEAREKNILMDNPFRFEKQGNRKNFRFYDAQSGKWYRAKLKKNVERNSYNWSKLVNNKKKNIIKYQDANYSIRRGIDVYYRNGLINWKKVKKAGIDFAFIRLGYRGYGHNGSLQIDKYFYRNIKDARKAGIDVGVYLFSQAVNKREAIEEADLVIKTLRGTKLDLPVVYDPERILKAGARTNGVTGRQFTKNTLTFCKKIEKAGYEAMIYSNMYWMAYRYDMKKLENYRFWYADYRRKPQTPYQFSFWQYSADGRVDGVPTKVDLDVQFIPQDQENEIEQ